MQRPAPPLTSDAESILVSLLHESNHNPQSTTSILASRSGLAEKAAAAALVDLKAKSFVVGMDTSGVAAVALTKAGREAASELGVLPPEGAIGEFRARVTHLQHAILDVVVEHELRVAGGAATRSHIRTRVRGTIDPKPAPEAVNGAIDELAGSHLRLLGGSEPFYEATLRGLVASSWGSNVLTIVGKALAYLRASKESDPALFRYSWTSLRRTCALPMKALNLAHLGIAEAQLGRGLFNSEGDYWWSVPPDVDLLIEGGSAIDYVRKLLPQKVAPEVKEQPVSAEHTESTDSAGKILARVTALLEPSENPTVRLQEAFQRLPLHPAIAGASTRMFRDGHYRSAVLDACIALVNYVRDKSGRRDLDGSALMQHVFSVENPLLAFNKRRTQSERDEQQGFMQLFVGAMQGLRNPRAHDLVPDSPEEALECIVLLSLLARRVDRAKRVRPKGATRRKKPT